MWLHGSDDLDSNHDRIVVLFNANDEPQTISSATWVDQAFVLHPVQAASVDNVVKTTTFNAASGEFVVPGRTTAVFVVEQEYTYYMPIVAKNASLSATTQTTSPSTQTATDSSWAAIFALPLMLVGMMPSRRRNRS
jgi:hypothetical protein